MSRAGLYLVLQGFKSEGIALLEDVLPLLHVSLHTFTHSLPVCAACLDDVIHQILSVRGGNKLASTKGLQKTADENIMTSLQWAQTHS